MRSLGVALGLLQLRLVVEGTCLRTAERVVSLCSGLRWVRGAGGGMVNTIVDFVALLGCYRTSTAEERSN